MRAKFIRGEDPKEQIGIGNKMVQLGNQIEREVEKICIEFGFDPTTITKEISDEGVMVEFYEKGEDFKYGIYYDKNRDHYWVGNSRLGVPNFVDYNFPVSGLRFSVEYIKTFINNNMSADES